MFVYITNAQDIAELRHVYSCNDYILSVSSSTRIEKNGLHVKI